MSQFKLSSQVDINKVFLIKRHDLDARLDVEYYQPKHFELLTRLSASQYPVKTLKEISKKIVDGPFGSSVKANDYVENGIPFLRVADITHGDGTIELDGLIYISPPKHQEISRSTVFPNDVVIAKTGATMGAASIVPETIKEANIRGDLAAVVVNDAVLANYIVNFINTKIGQDLFWRLNSGATRGRVVISNLRKYPLVIPDVKKMLEINQFVDSAKIRKNQKEQQAQDLLAGINAYLLAELGIILPQQDTRLEKRMFTVPFSEITGGRLDSQFYVELPDLNGFSKLSSFAIVSGGKRLPLGEGYENEKTNYFYLRVADINNNGEINFQDIRHISQRIFDFLERYEIKNNELAISIAGTIGRICLVEGIEKDNRAILTENCAKISIKTNTITARFFEILLNLPIVQKQIELGYIQTTIPKLGLERIRNLYLPPIPTLEKQNEIATHITQIRAAAKQLQAEAAQILADAKAEVERMILGE
ncbi:MAG: restriction endonuclease subunit S [Methylobacter sp.]|jgi:restriction endonuclease S subunit|nr:restriction endonuclease subunit S [Methylobacter sp.]